MDDIRLYWNFGKYQIPTVSTHPNWVAKLGETSIYAAANTWALMVCTSEGTATWAPISNFQYSGSFPGVYQTPVTTSYPGIGILGQEVIYAAANTWALMTCVSDNTDTWVSINNFEPTVEYSGRQSIPVVSDYPAYAGRLGEMVLYVKGATWALLTSVSDGGTVWASVSNFFPESANYGKKTLPVSAVYPLYNGRVGEQAIYASATTWALLTCTCDNTAHWSATRLFFPGTGTDYGTQIIPTQNTLPTRVGRLGEMMFYSAANTWSLLSCTTDLTNQWSTIANFFPNAGDRGKFQFRFMTSATSTNGYVGEVVCFTAANTWALMMCTSDQTANWRPIANFLS